jgi:hypothetical protein
MFVSLCQQDKPLSYKGDDGNPKGIVFDFVNILKDRYGFNYTVRFADQNIIGDAETGIVGMVHRKVSATEVYTS